MKEQTKLSSTEELKEKFENGEISLREVFQKCESSEAALQKIAHITVDQASLNQGKVYLFFGFSAYAKGGIWDYKGIFPNVKMAKKALPGVDAKNEFRPQWDWYQIVDAETMEIVETKGYSAYSPTE